MTQILTRSGRLIAKHLTWEPKEKSIWDNIWKIK